MRFEDFSDIGGFLWWLLIKFCKTKLEDEQAEDKWARNILFLIVLGLIATFASVPVKIAVCRSALRGGDGLPVIAMTLKGKSTMPRKR